MGTSAVSPAVTARRIRRSRRPLPPLGLLVFSVGAASLGAEIAVARLLAPFFGASTIVWANTIAVVLVSLSVGYWVGGRMADRHPHLRGLCVVVLVAALLLGLVPLVAQPFLRTSVRAFDTYSVGAFFGSLIAVLGLVAIPVMMLGAVSPWAIRLRMHAVEDSGEVAGRMYAISTAGSLMGTFLAALLLIPQAGTQRTFLAFALVLALIALPAAGLRWLPVPVLLAALLALPPGVLKGAGGGARVVHERETDYQYVRVLEQPDGERTLELNEGVVVHSRWRPDTVLTRDYWDTFLVDPLSVLPAPPRRVAMLGFGAGTAANAYARYFPRTRIDGVEIDGELFDIGRRFFGLRERPELSLYAEDARPFLRRTAGRYDAIFIDAYRQPYIPFYLATREFFELARERLAPGGLVLINVGHPEGSDELERVLTATLRRAFPHVARDPVRPTNSMLLASEARIDREALRRAGERLPAALRPIALDSARRLEPGLRGGSVFTDDRAPVEWLVDASIVKYAAGE